jgi:membrane-bound lytic murein transglycosylase D
MRTWWIVAMVGSIGAAGLFSKPMWAKYLSPGADDFAVENESSDDDSSADDTMPVPTAEKPPEAPKPVVPSSSAQTEISGVWHPPDYLHQEKALGYSDSAFEIPNGMQERVQFWLDIYTKYTNDQGLLHDSKYTNLIYETIDLSDITNNSILTAAQKDKAKHKRVKEAKKMVAERLKGLAKVKDASELTGDDLRYYKMFDSIDEKNKFTEAARRGRLRYQAGQKDQFINGITQSGRYLRQMEEIFREEGLPVQLTRLPFVESSFNLSARSKVGASGIWQFMRSSGRLYLRMDDVCDDRNDPLRATRAAARKLRQEFFMLQTWPLTVTGWNHGAAGIRRMTEKYKSKELGELTDVRGHRFGFASANFFASFLAALEAEKNAGKYFGILPVLPEVKGDDIKLEKDLSVSQILKWFNDDLELAKLYNPHIRSTAWSKGARLHRRDYVRVPSDILAKVNLDLGGAAAAN